MKGSGLLMLLGKPKGSSSKDEESEGYSPGDDVWSALKDDDKKGFLAALKEYVRSCSKHDEDEDDEDE